MRYILLVLVFLVSCAPAPLTRGRVCTPSRCLPDEEFNTYYCNCQLRDDAIDD